MNTAKQRFSLSVATGIIRRVSDAEVRVYVKKRVALTCSYCAQDVVRLVWPGQEPTHCSARCGRRAAERRRRRRKSTNQQVFRRPNATALPVGESSSWHAAVDTRLRLGRASERRQFCDDTGKVSYISLEEAWVVSIHDFPDAATLGAYPCLDSGHFHIGNRAPGKMGAQRRRAEIEYRKALQFLASAE